MKTVVLRGYHISESVVFSFVSILIFIYIFLFGGWGLVNVATKHYTGPRGKP